MNEMILAEKNGKKVYINYECIKCGNCCRSGFEVRVCKKDIINWIRLGKEKFTQNIKIDPKCIAPEGLGGYHLHEREDGKSLGKLFQNFSEEEKDELINFIMNHHTFKGQDEIPLPIYTFLPNKPSRPVFIPKTLEIVKQGLKRKLVYILRFNLNTCPFLKDNLCSIHEIKPEDCKYFPFDRSGNCYINDYELKICKGMQEIGPAD